ncbi:unnamed protein product (plasmid) [Mycetohabitans rhizoxinica HKI 454]|uniref:Uncharacterized protein n=1 Tax=Mycetohabitans rhizoxinica (strain DSM 19002 / CIP 109453 / HKI 454) TaxID=882378 RepID=E5AW40_MYCRK|nr:unnamed protein product [Mycetohabitans rhizoxinica HKI 454]
MHTAPWRLAILAYFFNAIKPLKTTLCMPDQQWF